MLLLMLPPWHFVCVVAAAALMLLLHCHSERRTNLPPSPFKLPLIGNLHQLISRHRRPHRSLAALSRKHGPLMLLHMGQVPTLVVSSPDAAREIMKTQDHIFSSRPSLKVANRLFYGGRDVTFAPYGDYWRSVRKLSLVHLLGPPKVRSYVREREEEVAYMIDKISRSCSLGAINVSEVLVAFAKDVIGRIAFGRCSRDEEWNETIDVLIEESNDLLVSLHVGDYIPWLSWLSAVAGLDARVEKTFTKLDRVLEEILQGCTDRRRRRRRERGDGFKDTTFVDVLLSLQENPSMEFALTKESIKALLEDMFGAGTDSTIIVLEWTMAELLRNPKVMKKLQEEVRSIATPKSMVTEADLIHMNYLKAVIKEIMRLHPPGPLLVPRESVENTNIQGYDIPKGTRVIVNCWAICRDAMLWEASEEFRPERFLDSHVDFRGNHFQLIPFGAGRRSCPGLNFANSVIELALANLVYRFDWKLPHGMVQEDMDMEEAPGLTSRTKISLHFVAKPHSNYEKLRKDGV